jgi:GNAT superfamily N-acetyltransferase
MIEVTLVQPAAEVLERYAGVASEFEVVARLESKALDSGAIVPVALDRTYAKSLDDDPRDWTQRYDLGRWALFLASDGGTTAGACAVACGVPNLYFESEPDDALLWDIRVAPSHRGRGIGKALLNAAIAWAWEEGCKNLLIETQDTNVAACQLYSSAGCTVASVQRGVYETYPDESLVVWRLPLR